MPRKDFKKKILITGSGRCGTTFLVRLFTFVDINTGFTKESLLNREHAKNNPGLERFINIRDPEIIVLKSPFILKHHSPDWSIDDQWGSPVAPRDWIKSIIVPLRDFKEVALSRTSRGLGNPGGPQYWPIEELVKNYGKKRPGPPTRARARAIQADLSAGMINDLTKVEIRGCEWFHDQLREQEKLYNLPVRYLDFKSMTTSPDYLYEGLKDILDEHGIDKPFFDKGYEQATSLWIKGEF
tara:strand:+ start:6621 stop:7340 length:720 start_codon:yes stop_codon:yes gene_type:complete